MEKGKKVIVSNITIKDMSPKLKDNRFKHLLPKLKPERISFEIENVSNAVSNGLRRTIACELEVAAMHVEEQDVKTNDVFIIPEMVTKRFKMVPLVQSKDIISGEVKFELIATNDTNTVRDVKSGEIKIISKHSGKMELPFDENFTMFTLQSMKSIKISPIVVHKHYGYIPGEGMCVLAVQVVSSAVGVEPLNVYEGTGVSSKVTNVRHWEIKFETNGTMPVKKVVVMACDNLIERLTRIYKLIPDIAFDGDLYSVVIDGESDTIGNLFTRTACDMFPDLDFIRHKTGKFIRQVRIDIRYKTSDISIVFKAIIDELVTIYTTIKSYFV